jgi:hypothetical protein
LCIVSYENTVAHYSSHKLNIYCASIIKAPVVTGKSAVGNDISAASNGTSASGMVVREVTELLMLASLASIAPP